MTSEAQECEAFEKWWQDMRSYGPTGTKAVAYTAWSASASLSTTESGGNAEIDAARYRWLRTRDVETIHRGGVFAGLVPDNVVMNLEDLDRHIDEAMAAEAGAASPTTPVSAPSVGVKVKELEWREDDQFARAESVFGPYQAAECLNGEWTLILNGIALDRSKSREGAKAAGQAHFERAILSALTPSLKGVKHFDPATSPGMTDMMVAPETFGAFMEANPLPAPKGVDAVEVGREAIAAWHEEGCDEATVFSRSIRSGKQDEHHAVVGAIIGARAALKAAGITDTSKEGK